MQRLPAEKWRNIIYSQWVLLGLAAAAALWIPESPRWLVGKGRIEQARKVLTHVYGRCDKYDIETELERMVYEVEYSKKEKAIRALGSYRDVFRGTNFVGPLSAALLRWMCAERSSCDWWRRSSRIISKRRSAFPSSPFTARTSLAWWDCPIRSTPLWPQGTSEEWLTVLALVLCLPRSVTQLVCCIFAVYLVERLGRRSLVLGGGIGCICCLIAMGTAAKVAPTKSADGLVALA